MENNRINMFQAGIIFSVSVVLFIIYSVIGTLFISDFYLSGIIGEVLPILLPSLIGIAIFKKNIKASLKLNGFRISDAILVIIITLCYMPLNLAVNALNMWLVKVIFGQNLNVEIPIAQTGGELVISILVIGVTAAVCEEVLFRGILQGSMEKLGKAGMFIIVSVLFAAFHFNIEHFLGVFVLSLLIGFIVYRTNSLYMGMLAHFTNNTAAVVISFFANKIPEDLVDQSLVSVEGIPEIVEYGILGIIVVFFSIIAGVLIYALYKNTEGRKTKLEISSKMESREIVSFVPGLIVMAGMFLFTITLYITYMFPVF
ncbi:MAG: CPBP family intramembrane metalloprotease [Clostridia bacterium]|nr:CPBP family intramembrane metalloprotease [Clostridia bacterium]MBN2883369.1 CPBP family intramembrane metalloprotease [Clostridia bacterium]